MSIVRVKNREIGHSLGCEQINMSMTNIEIFHNMPICHSLKCDINNQYWSSSATVGTLSKVRRQRQRERHKTKGLMTEQWLCTCVLIFCKFLSRPMQNNNAKWQSSGYFGECERQRLIFHILFWNWMLALHYQTWAISETDRRTEQI